MYNKKKKWIKRIVEVRRVIKIWKGGRKLSFRVLIILGNNNGKVGMGIAKTSNITTSIEKAALNAKHNLINVKLTKFKSISHEVLGKCKASKILLKPASNGVGVIAGKCLRIILELAGFENIVTKQLGSNNLINNAHATIYALKNLI